MEDKVYRFESTPEEWKGFINVMRSGLTVQIDEEMYFYWLEVLPPAYMGRVRKIDVLDNGIFELVPCAFGFAEGIDYITDFWKKDGKFYCKLSDVLKTWD